MIELLKVDLYNVWQSCQIHFLAIKDTWLVFVYIIGSIECIKNKNEKPRVRDLGKLKLRGAEIECPSNWKERCFLAGKDSNMTLNSIFRESKEIHCEVDR